MDKRLNASGLVTENGEEIMKYVYIPQEEPVEVMVDFPNYTRHPLYLTADHNNCVLHNIYFAGETEDIFKKHGIAQIKKVFKTYPISYIESNPFSNVRFVKAYAWGMCCYLSDTDQIISQYIKLIEFISLADKDLKPMTASYALLKRSDLTEEEVENCYKCVVKEEYNIYSHMLLSKEFRYDFIEHIKDEKVMANIINGIKKGNIIVEHPVNLKMEVDNDIATLKSLPKANNTKLRNSISLWSALEFIIEGK